MLDWTGVCALQNKSHVLRSWKDVRFCRLLFQFSYVTTRETEKFQCLGWGRWREAPASLPLLCVITSGCRLFKAFLFIHLSSLFTLLFCFYHLYISRPFIWGNSGFFLQCLTSWQMRRQIFFFSLFGNLTQVSRYIVSIFFSFFVKAW